MLPADVEAAIDEYHKACAAVLAGDPAPLVQFYSPHEDVTLANPWGPPVRGTAQVAATVAAAASHYRDGYGTAVERIGELATPELAYVVEIERYEAKVSGGAQQATLAVRVTSVFRLEQGGWKVTHRHADPITAPQQAESVFSTGGG